MHSAHLPETWNNLYLMLGTSSAALIGLLFVATSLHLSEIVNDAVYKLRAEYTTVILLGTLVQATAILTPQPTQILGAELLVMNLFGISFPFQLLRKAITIKASQRRGGFSIHRAAFFIMGYLFGIAGAAVMAAGAEWGMYLVTACYANCLIACIWNAWMIMLGVGQSEKKRVR
jgi:hypothetical protein